MQDGTQLLITTYLGNPAQVREKDFSQMLTKVMRAKSDFLLTTIKGDSMLVQLEGLIDVLSASRGLVRPLGNYNRSHKSSHLEKMLPCIEKLFAYCSVRKLTPPNELVTIHMRAGFHVACQSKGGLDAGLVFLDEHQPSEDSSSSDAVSKTETLLADLLVSWLFERLSQPLKDATAACSTDEKEEKTNGWALVKSKFDSEVASLVTFCAADRRKQWSGIAKLVAHVRTFAAAALDHTTVSPASLSKSLSYIGEDPLCLKVREALKVPGIGQSMKMDAQVHPECRVCREVGRSASWIGG